MALRVACLLSSVAVLVLGAAIPAAASDLGRLIAPPSVCPGQGDAGAGAASQERTMRCMTNFARRKAHVPRLAQSRQLDRSSRMKSRDIIRCDAFSHYACGRDFTYWFQRVGYLPAACWRAGENIAWGSGSYAGVRAIFSAWIHSPGHRQNILSRDYRQFGVGLEVGGLGRYGRAHVWTQHFGIHC
jgi:uncharacterized protein YkwD